MAEIKKDKIARLCTANQLKLDNTTNYQANWTLEKHILAFKLSFLPCSADGKVLPYEQAKVFLLKTSNYTEDCHPEKSEIIDSKSMGLNSDPRIAYQSQELRGDEFYCLYVTQNEHLLCQNDSDSQPHICSMSSRWIWVEAKPLIAKYLPYCSSHFKCAWIYLSVILSGILTFSCLLAVCIIYCCCRRGSKKRRLSQAGADSIPFEGMKLQKLRMKSQKQ